MLIRLGLCGYRAWHQPGSRSGTNRGGLVVAVRDDMRASLCHQSVGEFGNLMTLNLEAWHLTVVWRRPSPDTGDASFVHALAEHHALAENHPWAAIGDWNWCPDEHVFLQGNEFSASVALDEHGHPRPTRREGRAIDYLVAQHLQATEPSLDEEIFRRSFSVSGANSARRSPSQSSACCVPLPVTCHLMACPVTSGGPLSPRLGASTMCRLAAQKKSGRTSVLTPSPLFARPALAVGPLVPPRCLDLRVPCRVLSKPLTPASDPCANPSPRAAWQSLWQG